LVEPQDHLKTYIRDLIEKGHRIQWINAGAFDQTGVLPLTITSRDDSCTFVSLPDNGAELSKIMVPVRTLNEIAASSNAPPPEIIKIDAEGLDLQVLDGASDLLGKQRSSSLKLCFALFLTKTVWLRSSDAWTKPVTESWT
jgi:FkbM family methyltransferase